MWATLKIDISKVPSLSRIFYSLIHMYLKLRFVSNTFRTKSLKLAIVVKSYGEGRKKNLVCVENDHRELEITRKTKKSCTALSRSSKML